MDTGFAVSPGTVLDVVISAKGAGVEGTVIDREGKPAAGASVVTAPGGGKTSSGQMRTNTLERMIVDTSSSVA